MPRQASSSATADYLPRAIDWVTVTSPTWLLNRSSGEYSSYVLDNSRVLTDAIAWTGLTDQQGGWRHIPYLDCERFLGASHLPEVQLYSHDLEYGTSIVHRSPLLRQAGLTKGCYLLVFVERDLRWVRLVGKAINADSRTRSETLVLRVHCFVSSRDNLYRAVVRSDRRQPDDKTAGEMLRNRHSGECVIRKIFLRHVRGVLNSAVGDLYKVPLEVPKTVSFEQWDQVIYPDEKERQRSGWVIRGHKAGSSRVAVWSARHRVRAQAPRNEIAIIDLLPFSGNTSSYKRCRYQFPRGR